MEHRNLTGDSLHEPKGAESATAGQVYVATGTGTGTWTDRLSGILNLNAFSAMTRLDNVSEPGSAFLSVPQKANLVRVTGVLSGPITGTNSVLTIYKNGIAQTPTLTVPVTGSGAGVSQSFAITPNILFNEADVLEIRGDGGSTGAATYSLGLKFVAVA